MTYGRIVCAVLLCGAASASFACDMPALIAIPAKDAVAGKEQELRDAMAVYYQGMQAYTACVQKELEAAGGDKAQPIVRSVLVQRNNMAVAEVQTMVKLFNANVGQLAAAGGAESHQGQDTKDSKEGRHRK